MFKKILIVNRGEIAVRIIRACKEMNIISAVLYSEADRNSLHTRMADESYFIGPSPASESYLNISKIIQTAKRISADAIHPGYGFLSENASFINQVENTGIKFIGPTSHSVELMGEKTAARTIMKKHGVPIVPGTTEPINDLQSVKDICAEIGFPVMLKASAGGGGKGMRKIESAAEIESAYRGTKSEAKKSFGNDDVYIEKFVVNPKHIEVQILGDSHGNYRHLFERECSIQRRHQKIIEEAPSISINKSVRKVLTEAAVNAAKAVNYVGAGTIEFLMDDDKNVYFLEMNTRLQVEHPVTELISGIDLVKEQINIAAGGQISFEQDDLKINGHAIECRVYAEDSENNFAPSTGKINYFNLPAGPGIRVDSGIDELSDVSIYYDPMLAKVITHSDNRNDSIARMIRALNEFKILGVKTNIELLKWVLKQSKFLDGSFNIEFIDKYFMPLLPDKWKDDIQDNILIAASIIASMLKQKGSELKAANNFIPDNNGWGKMQYE